MGSQFIRNRECRSLDKAYNQQISTLVSAVIMPIYKSPAWGGKNLPKTIKREKDESVVDFKARVNLDALKYVGSHIKYNVIIKGVLHFKV